MQTTMDFLPSPAPASASSTSQAKGSPYPSPAERFWFVALGATDVGPLNLDDVSALWRARELTPESLVWKPGMVDWQPIATINELCHLVRAAARNRAEPVVPAIRWQLSEAMSLETLVARELEMTESEQKLAAAPAPEIWEDGLPTLTQLGFVKSPPLEPMGPPLAVLPWAAPHPLGKQRWLPGVLLGMAATILALGLVVAALTWRPPMRAVPIVVAEPAVAFEPTLETDIGPVALVSDAESASATEMLAEAPAATVEKTQPPKKRVRRRRAPVRAHAPPPAPIGRALTKSEIVTTVRKNASSLKPCFQAALSAKRVEPGRLRVDLDWTVDANGRVRNARLVGPQNVVGTPLSACVATKMSGWRFPKSGRSSNVHNFTLPLTLR